MFWERYDILTNLLYWTVQTVFSKEPRVTRRKFLFRKMSQSIWEKLHRSSKYYINEKSRNSEGNRFSCNENRNIFFIVEIQLECYSHLLLFFPTNPLLIKCINHKVMWMQIVSLTESETVTTDQTSVTSV